MNDLCISSVQIQNIGMNDNTVKLFCIGKIPVDGVQGNYFDCNVNAYMERSVYDGVVESEATCHRLDIGNSVMLTGRATFTSDAQSITVSMLIPSSQYIEMPRKKLDAKIKLFDVTTGPKLVARDTPSGKEVLCEYVISDARQTKGNILVCVPPNKGGIVMPNSSYNLAGELVMRHGNKKTPVIRTSMFIRDVPLTDNFKLAGLDF